MDRRLIRLMKLYDRLLEIIMSRMRLRVMCALVLCLRLWLICVRLVTPSYAGRRIGFRSLPLVMRIL